MIHIRYLGDIPLAHVAVQLFGVVEHCEEKEGTRVSTGKYVSQGDDKTNKENEDYLLRYIVDTFPTSHALRLSLNDAAALFFLSPQLL